MGGVSFRAQAETVAVGAQVFGPPPTTPATIVLPAAGSRFSDIPILVSGTCYAGNMVKLYRNNSFSGAVRCASDHTFQLQTDLYEGANELTALPFDALNQAGPASPSMFVYYDVAESGSESSDASAVPQFVLVAENLYKGYFTGDVIEWQLTAVGGTPPYAFTIDWGDGSSDLISRASAGDFKVKHTYKKSGDVDDSYAIKVRASDGAGNNAFLQLMVIVREKDGTKAVPGLGSASTPPPLRLPFSFKVLWPAYGVTLLMAVSFWLGERRELLMIKPRIRPHKF